MTADSAPARDTVSLEKRLRGLQRHVWALSAALMIVFALWAGVFALFISGHIPAHWLQTNALSVVDSSGVETARLSNEREGPLLMLRARKLGSDIFIGAFPDEAGLSINVGGTPRLSLYGAGNGLGPSLDVSRKDGKTGVIVGVDDHDDNAHVLLWGADHRKHLFLGTGKEPGIIAADSAGTETIRLPAGGPGGSAPTPAASPTR